MYFNDATQERFEAQLDGLVDGSAFVYRSGDVSLGEFINHQNVRRVAHVLLEIADYPGDAHERQVPLPRFDHDDE